MNSSPTSVMLQHVATRLRLASFGRRFYLFWIATCIAYGALLLTSRLTGVIPDGFTLTTLVAIPLVAAGLGLLFHRRPSVIEAARAVDKQSGAKDLFLTTVLLEKSPGEFKPLVARDAEAKTPRVRPVQVVPFVWHKQLGYAALSIGALFAADLLLPQFDPFGKVQAATKVAEMEEKLEETQEATRQRTAQVRKDAEEASESKEVEQAIEELKGTLNRMQPLAKAENLKGLMQSQKQLGEKWMKISAQKLKDLLSQSSSSQQFGGSNQEQMQKWTRELQEGSTDSLSKEIEQLQIELQKLTKINDPVKRQQEIQKARKKLQELADFASENVKSKPLSAAVQRALDQLALAKVEGLSEKALEALSESLNLAALELKEIAQSVQDLEKLEKSLKTLQMAKALNDGEKLDGNATKGLNSLEEYEALYAKLMMEQGSGLGGEGFGEGGQAPEDDSVKSDFKSERSKSPITPGKVLLTLKSKGLGDPAEVEKNHRELIKQAKQGLSEAVLQEQVPPGYREGIKKYFDNFDNVGTQPAENEE